MCTVCKAIRYLTYYSLHKFSSFCYEMFPTFANYLCRAECMLSGSWPLRGNLVLTATHRQQTATRDSCLRTQSEKVLCLLRNLGERTVITQIFMGSLYCMSHWGLARGQTISILFRAEISLETMLIYGAAISNPPRKGKKKIMHLLVSSHWTALCRKGKNSTEKCF